MTNIAVYGGSFDPPHIAHEEIIQKALQNLDIERLFIVPTFLNPFKNSVTASAKLRASWIQKMIEPYKKAKLLRYEIEQNRAVPTIETIRYLKKTETFNKIYLIIGADNLPHLHKWKDFQELEKLVEFVIATRDEQLIPKNLQKIDICANISSTKLRENIEKQYIPKSIADDVMNFYSSRRKMNQRIEKIIDLLDEKKAENIQLFDMKDRDYFVNEVIIASTLNQKHGLALLDYLKKELKGSESYLEVEPSEDWSIVDLGDMLIHLMTPEYRAKYNIEEFLSKREEESNDNS